MTERIDDILDTVYDKEDLRSTVSDALMKQYTT